MGKINVSNDVDSMLQASDNEGIRNSIGLEAGEFGQQLLKQPTKRFAQDLLSVPLPFAAFVHTLNQDEWRKAAKFTSTKATAISGTIKSSTGYIKCLDHDGTWEAVVGDGVAGNNQSVNFTASGDNIPRFYAIIPCDAAGTVTGDLTFISLNSNQLTSFDGTGLISVSVLYLNSNQLTSFDGTGLSSVTSLSLNSNQLTSFDGTGLSSVSELYLSNNQLTSFDGTGLSSVTSLNLSNNQLTSFDGTGVSSVSVLSLYDNQLTSFDGTGLSSVSVLYLSSNQLTSFDGTGLSSVSELYLSNNQLTSFTVGDLRLYDKYSLYTALDLSNQQLDAAAIQTIYGDLHNENPDTDGYPNTINVTGNSGAGTGSGTEPSVATAKGWTVVGDVA